MSAVKAGAAYVELTTKNAKFIKGLQSAQQRLHDFGKSMSLLGGKVVGLGVAGIAPLLAMAKGFSDVGDAVQKMSIRTGLSTEAVSELGFAAEQSGSDLPILEKGIIGMQKALDAARAGSGPAAEALARLGLTADELLGMSTEEQFKILAEAISQLENPASKATTAMDLFGKSGQKLIPFLDEGRDGIQALQDEAKGLGLSISQDEADSAAELNDALNRLTRSLKAIPLVIGGAVAPALTSLLAPMTKIVVAASNWIKTNRALFVTALKVAAAIIAGGAAIAGLGLAIAAAGSVLGGLATMATLAASAIGVIGTITAAVLSPLGLLLTGAVALGAYLVHSSGIGAQAIAYLGDKFSVLKTDAIASWGAIGKALASGDIAAAGKILWLTLKMEWIRGTNWLHGHWLSFKNAFLATTQSIIYGAAGLLSDGWAAIEVAWIETVAFLGDSWSVFTGTLMKTWNSTVGFIRKAWVRLKSLFDSEIQVDAEIQRINQETAAKNESAGESMLGQLAERDQQRRTARGEIEQNRQGREAALQQMQSAEEAARRTGTDAALAAAQAELDVAKQEWQGAIAAVNDSVDAAADSKKSSQQNSIAELQSALSQSADSVASEKKAIENKSTFNAFAIRGLGADSLSDRALRAAEQTAANTQRLIRVIEQNGLSYS